MSSDRLRWAIFPVSIISSFENPSAYFWRALDRRLRQRGHRATFFEERDNRALDALIRRERSAGLNAFRQRFPDLHYQTVDQRSGFALAEWLTRTLSTVDIALVDCAASLALIAELSEFSRPFLQTFLVDPGWQSAPPAATSVGNLTGVLVGNDALAARYAQLITAARIYPIGPLPPEITEPEPTGDQVEELDHAAERAISTIVGVSETIRRARSTQIVANGHADPTEASVPLKPD